MQNQVIDWLALYTHTNKMFRAGYTGQRFCTAFEILPVYFSREIKR